MNNDTDQIADEPVVTDGPAADATLATDSTLATDAPPATDQHTDEESAEHTSESSGEPTAEAAGDAVPAVDPSGAPADGEADVVESGDLESNDMKSGDIENGDAAVPAAEKADEATGGETSARVRQLEREGEVAADFLETLLDICDLDGDLDVDIDGDRAAVSIVDSEDGRVPRRLVGDGAKVLEALQELTRLAVQSATGDRSRLMLDVAGHRAGRRAELVTIAREAIATVKESGDRVPLSPMTAFERKVVHDEVLAAGLVSESEGVEPRRFVVIVPA